MNATGKQMIAFWLHKKGEHWSLKSVDKDSNPEVCSFKSIYLSKYLKGEQVLSGLTFLTIAQIP